LPSVMQKISPPLGLDLDEVMLEGSDSYLISAVRQYAREHRQNARRIGPVLVGDIWIEDARVYRSAA
jgi:hypothetical protein